MKSGNFAATLKSGAGKTRSGPIGAYQQRSMPFSVEDLENVPAVLLGQKRLEEHPRDREGSLPRPLSNLPGSRQRVPRLPIGTQHLPVQARGSRGAGEQSQSRGRQADSRSCGRVSRGEGRPVRATDSLGQLCEDRGDALRGRTEAQQIGRTEAARQAHRRRQLQIRAVATPRAG